MCAGRPLRTKKTPYIMEWETSRRAEIEQLCAAGVIPMKHDLKQSESGGAQARVAGKPRSQP